MKLMRASLLAVLALSSVAAQAQNQDPDIVVVPTPIAMGTTRTLSAAEIATIEGSLDEATVDVMDNLKSLVPAEYEQFSVEGHEYGSSQYQTKVNFKTRKFVHESTGMAHETVIFYIYRHGPRQITIEFRPTLKRKGVYRGLATLTYENWNFREVSPNPSPKIPDPDQP